MINIFQKTIAILILIALTLLCAVSQAKQISVGRGDTVSQTLYSEGFDGNIYRLLPLVCKARENKSLLTKSCKIKHAGHLFIPDFLYPKTIVKVIEVPVPVIVEVAAAPSNETAVEAKAEVVTETVVEQMDKSSVSVILGLNYNSSKLVVEESGRSYTAQLQREITPQLSVLYSPNDRYLVGGSVSSEGFGVNFGFKFGGSK